MPEFGIIGWPVDHSKSPELFKKAYGGRYGYDLIGDPSFERCWDRFVRGGYKAVNVTAPFKEEAFRKADWASPETAAIGAANIIVRDGSRFRAYNSDYMGVRKLLSGLKGTLCVVGFGGAGKAAFAAANDEGFTTILKRHDEIKGGIDADVVIYTLPRYAEGAGLISCRVLIEANYKDPCLVGLEGVEHYISGEEWLRAQAETGYVLMTGEEPDSVLL